MCPYLRPASCLSLFLWTNVAVESFHHAVNGIAASPSRRRGSPQREYARRTSLGIGSSRGADEPSMKSIPAGCGDDGTRTAVKPSAPPVDIGHAYATYWEDLLTSEHREVAAELRSRRSSWSRSRLESTGTTIFDATAEPETELFGEKIVRITKLGETGFKDRYSMGDILVLTATNTWRSERFLPREGCVVDVGSDWMTLSVGPTWPAGLWEERRRPGSYGVRLDRTAPQAALLAQRKSLQLVRKGQAGGAAAFLADAFYMSREDTREGASESPTRFAGGAYVGGIAHDDIDEAIQCALGVSKNMTAAKFKPNASQEDAIVWALGRRVSLVRGPPGTGKTRLASLLIAAALRLRGRASMSSPSPANKGGNNNNDNDMPRSMAPPPRVLAVAHSNGAADVLLEALLSIGVPAIRAGRPATVSPKARRWTVTALTETHPEVVALRARSRNVTLPGHVRSAAAMEAIECANQVRTSIAEAAPVVVASCIGAHQLLKDGFTFPLVVLDEAAQTTEPALITALAASKAEQLVLVGDTRQLPPTVASGMPDLRAALGVSPMSRLEAGSVEERTLRVQYRMPPSLLEHPSRYFYDDLVSCAEEEAEEEEDDAYGRRDPPLPAGFPWPGDLPLAFIDIGGDLEVTHDFGGRSNPSEAELVVRIVLDLLNGDDGNGGELDVTAGGTSIAVISPYSRQVDLIRGELAARNVRDVKVGTVDSFQGQEKDLVIISGTRSNSVGDIGFLRDPRRLCVAITRARRGLIVVGDGRTLRNSRHWRALLDSCRDRGCDMDAKDLPRPDRSSSGDADSDDLDGCSSSLDAVDLLFSSEDPLTDALADLLR